MCFRALAPRMASIWWGNVDMSNQFSPEVAVAERWKILCGDWKRVQCPEKAISRFLESRKGAAKI